MTKTKLTIRSNYRSIFLFFNQLFLLVFVSSFEDFFVSLVANKTKKYILLIHKIHIF